MLVTTSKKYSQQCHEPAFHMTIIRDKNPLGKTDKKRRIFCPNTAMRLLHARYSKFLRALPSDLSSARGSLPRCSPLKNVACHRDHRFFYLLDIKDAYLSVDSRRLIETICSLFPPTMTTLDKEHIQKTLETHFVSDIYGLPVGGPASPDLFNLYASVALDPALRLLSKRYGLIYTRYTDDLTFSSRKRIGKKKRRVIRHAIEQAGFRLSEEKTAVLDLKKNPITINGIGLEYGGRLFLPRHYLRTIRGILYRAITTNDISPSKIFGMMGVFWSSCDQRKLNSTEKKIVALYLRYLEKLDQRRS